MGPKMLPEVPPLELDELLLDEELLDALVLVEPLVDEPPLDDELLPVELLDDELPLAEPLPVDEVPLEPPLASWQRLSGPQTRPVGHAWSGQLGITGIGSEQAAAPATQARCVNRLTT